MFTAGFESTIARCRSSEGKAEIQRIAKLQLPAKACKLARMLLGAAIF